MTGVGIAWSSILSMPYAMLAGSLPEDKIGVYMGIFNFFIVLPEIIASLFFGWIMEHLLENNRMLAVQIGGGMMILAALVCYLWVSEKLEKPATESQIALLEIEGERPV
jgi:maltose/moltooligosaccharide transporter